MTQQGPTHPTPESLVGFAQGRLEDADAVAIAEHLDVCASCQQAVLAIPNDPLFALLCSGSSTPVPHPDLVALTVSHVDVGMPSELRDHPRYRLLQRLGAGGMGEVYKAEHRLMRRTVALKVISKQLTASPSIVERFRRETRAVALLSHPNLVQAYDAEQAGELHFLVMEFIEGVSLAALVERDGPLAVERACDCVRQAALGLAHALERGLVHRDIKPQNLMLTPQGQIKVLDFGLASISTEQWGEQGLTAVGQPMGTPDFMAPEQIRDARTADARADVYSLGCTLYFLLSGRPPFLGGNTAQKFAAHLEQKPEAIAALRSGLAPELVRVVERMMAKNPAARFQVPGEVISALEPFCKPRREKPTGRNWLLTAALLALAAVTGLAVLWHRSTFPMTSGSGAGERRPSGPPGEIHRFDHEVHVRQLAVTPNGQWAVSGCEDGTVWVWDVASKAKVTHWKAASEPIQALAVSPDGRWILSSGGGKLDGNGHWILGEDFQLHLWSQAGKPIRSFKGHTGVVFGVAFSADGKQALSGGMDGTLRLWDVETGRQLRPAIEIPETRIHCVAFSPDGTRALTGDNRNLVRLWDLATGNLLRTFDRHKNEVMCVAFAPDGSKVLSGGIDQTLRVWDVASGKQLHCLEHPTVVRSVAFSRDGQQALSGSGEIMVRGVLGPAEDDWVLRLWDVKTGQRLRTFPGHASSVLGVAFLPDGYRALSCSRDTTVRLWRLQGDEEPGPEKPIPRTLAICDADWKGIDAAWRLGFSEYVPVWFHAHDAGGQTRFAVIFNKDICFRRYAGTSVHFHWHTRTPDLNGHKDFVRDMAKEGFRPLGGTAFRHGSSMKYASLWHRDGQPAGSLQFYSSREEFETRLVELLPKPSTIVSAVAQAGGLSVPLLAGWTAETRLKTPEQQRPAQINGYPTGNGCGFAVLWEKDDGTPYRVEHNLTAAEYQKLLQKAKIEGYRPISVSAYPHNGQLFFTTVLLRDDPKLEWHASPQGLTHAEFNSENDQMMKDSYKPVILSGYFHNNESRYLAVWLRGDPPKPPLPQTGKAAPALQKFDQAMQQFMQERSIRAGTLAVVKDGRLVLSRGYGHSDREGKREVLPDDPFAWPASPSRSPPPPSAN